MPRKPAATFRAVDGCDFQGLLAVFSRRYLARQAEDPGLRVDATRQSAAGRLTAGIPALKSSWVIITSRFVVLISEGVVALRPLTIAQA